MTRQTFSLVALMRTSWQIQRTRQISRAKAITSAWAIFQNADIMVYHLARKHSRKGIDPTRTAQHLTLFIA
ncbi:hypothetical protein [Chitinophaga sp. Ak27]|uniref:hypothetical protein n=1 Tax=Chitinophaga sp. Ak27 TaxID=2726116 RepID=UPI00145E5381|nr:hypothetical protein [Chitinophaga sp. Ak27]NLU91370.1 hypothetical protein [Chitinophaga sp. Ak27]